MEREREREKSLDGVLREDAAANRGEIISLNYVIGIVSNVHPTLPLAHFKPKILAHATTIAQP